MIGNSEDRFSLNETVMYSGGITQCMFSKCYLYFEINFKFTCIAPIYTSIIYVSIWKYPNCIEWDAFNI